LATLSLSRRIPFPGKARQLARNWCKC